MRSRSTSATAGSTYQRYGRVRGTDWTESSVMAAGYPPGPRYAKASFGQRNRPRGSARLRRDAGPRPRRPRALRATRSRALAEGDLGGARPADAHGAPADARARRARLPRARSSHAPLPARARGRAPDAGRAVRARAARARPPAAAHARAGHGRDGEPRGPRPR